MKEQAPQLYLLADEWARLRQRAETERDTVNLVVIVDRLNTILSDAERLLCLDEESTQESGPDARRHDSSREKSGESD